MNANALEACLLGGALGDSIGLPSEGMNARRIAKLRTGPLRQCLVGRYGMISDDTEHAVMTLLALYHSQGDARKFGRDLAGRLRGWFAGLPAGIGLATAKSILKLFIGVGYERSGVWSAGNGPLMRAPVIGIWFADDESNRRRFLEVSTRMTHRDPRALESALIVAKAAAIASIHGNRINGHEILGELEKDIESTEMRTRFPLLRQALEQDDTVTRFTDRFTRKPGYITGFAPDSAAVAIYAWLRHRNDFRATIESVVRAGGDTDTIAFISGSIAAIDCGTPGLPGDWLSGLRDWPISLSLIGKISKGHPTRYPAWPANLPRNLVFLAIVLGHGFRRLLPPY